MIKNEAVKKYLTLTLFLVVILGLIIGTSYLLAPVKNNNITKEKLKKYSNITDKVTRVEEIEFESNVISEKLKGFDKNGEEVLTLYTAGKSNQYGYIEIIVAVDLDGVIEGIDSTVMDQSIKPDETKAFLKGFKGSQVSSPVSNITSPTVVISVGTVEEILSEVSKSHGVVLTNFDLTFGEGASRVDKVLNDGVVTSFEKVNLNNELVGYVYTAKDKFDYDQDGEPSEGVIEMEIYLNKDNILIGYDYLTYEHTGGFQKLVNNYLDSLIENNINIFNAKDHFLNGDFTGATGSATGVSNLLDEIASFIESGLELTYGEVVNINNGATYTVDGIIGMFLELKIYLEGAN